MSSVISEHHPSSSSEPDKPNNFPDDSDEPETQNKVTSHVYLKSTHSTETLDKDVILRRIRHRKRVNKVRGALQAFLSSPFSAKTNEVPVNEKKWLDDAFAAP